MIYDINCLFKLTSLSNITYLIGIPIFLLKNSFNILSKCVSKIELQMIITLQQIQLSICCENHIFQSLMSYSNKSDCCVTLPVSSIIPPQFIFKCQTMLESIFVLDYPYLEYGYYIIWVFLYFCLFCFNKIYH